MQALSPEHTVTVFRMCTGETVYAISGVSDITEKSDKKSSKHYDKNVDFRCVNAHTSTGIIISSRLCEIVSVRIFS